MTLGYDCDGNIIEEYRILRAIWSNNIDIRELKDADPRQYCAILDKNGFAYAISVYDYMNSELIRKYEHIKPYEEIPVIVKSIDEMRNYECALASDGTNLYYEFNKEVLKEELNQVLDNPTKVKKLR